MIHILGNGGHARVVSEACQELCQCTETDPPLEGKVFVAIGDNLKRLDLCIKYFTRMICIIHPKASISPSAKYEAGCFFAANCVVGPDTTLGLGVIVNHGATVDHGCVLHSCVHISPGAHLGGDVTVKACTWIGIGASVKHGVTIGRNVIVGAGAVVVNDIPDDVVVKGVPAK